MTIYKFQSKSASQIADRFNKYMENPPYNTRDKIVPFFQNLSAITGAGKTLILVDAISRIRMQLPVEPLVLWISKGKVVVTQTYLNLSTGKYAEFLPNFRVMPLLDCREALTDESKALLLVATVGKFNSKDMEKGDRLIYKVNLDVSNTSLWHSIGERLLSDGKQRPLIIVYDEGHNLSDQQTELLLKLNPIALISASATIRIPEYLNRKVIQRIIDENEWEVDDFCTSVKSSDVVNRGLVKKHIVLGGYVTPMEMAIDELMDDFNNLSSYIQSNKIDLKPKSIYVSNTNIVAETGEKDNFLIPFEQRQSRPIKIWRYLVNKHDVDPNQIAVYCNLKFDAKFPPPEEFHLFSGGDDDYNNFISKGFQHVIFNLSLQEGWDDPSCYFAYIDKDMGSKDQVTQIVGRVLRQPGSTHYPHSDLNTAHFYIRTDQKQVFDDVIDEIQKKISTDIPEITLSVYKGKSANKNSFRAIPRKSYRLPLTPIYTEKALEPIAGVINKIPDFRKDNINTTGKGSRIRILQTIGSKIQGQSEWIEMEHTNRVTARWLFKQELRKYFPRLENSCATEIEVFDALIEYNSKAADIIKEKAEEVVDVYIEHSVVIQDSGNTFEVPGIFVNPTSDSCHVFKNSIHEKYSDFNQFELEFAQELDKSKRVWFRNPKQGCFQIPLLDKGDSNNFNPDFVVWVDKKIIAIDTKGDHLIVGDAARKLFTLEKYGKGPDLLIKLVTAGEWNSEIKKTGKQGYTVWEFKNGKIVPHHTTNIKNCVLECLK